MTDTQAFLFLCCLLGVCLLVWPIRLAYDFIQGRRALFDLMRRDIRVKDELIRQLHLELAMLRVSMNMQALVAARKAKRGIYLVKGSSCQPS
jgi:hypothetical protein